MKSNNQKLRDWEKEWEELVSEIDGLATNLDVRYLRDKILEHRLKLKSFIKDLLEAREEALKQGVEEEIKELPEKLHEYYLDAVEHLDKENYNPNARKPYAELNIQQKSIDYYIASKTLERILTIIKETKE